MSFRNQPRLEDFPALGFIPCPGSQESMDSVDQTFSNTAEVLNEVLAVLTGADEGEWRGETAHAFREMLEDDFKPKVEDASQSFSDAHRSISDWLVDMEEFQNRAANLEEEAATARDQVQAAQAAVDGLPPKSDEPEEDQEQAEGDETPEERRERLEGDLTTAAGSLGTSGSGPATSRSSTTRRARTSPTASATPWTWRRTSPAGCPPRSTPSPAGWTGLATGSTTSDLD